MENLENQNPETQNPETQNPETQNPETQNPETQNPETQNLEGVDREQGETISPDQMGRPPLTRCDACPTFRASGHCDALPAAP